MLNTTLHEARDCRIHPTSKFSDGRTDIRIGGEDLSSHCHNIVFDVSDNEVNNLIWERQCLGKAKASGSQQLVSQVSQYRLALKEQIHPFDYCRRIHYSQRDICHENL